MHWFAYVITKSRDYFRYIKTDLLIHSYLAIVRLLSFGIKLPYMEMVPLKHSNGQPETI